MTAKRPLRVRLVGTNLPGRTFCEHQHVHVAVQCRSEPVDAVRGDASEAVFEFDVDILPGDDDGWDFRGPYVHGKRNERFLYLTWGDLPSGGEFTMFRRAKLHLSCLPRDLVSGAAAPGHQLVGRLSLTDGRGGPRCASVRPPAINWSAEPAHPEPTPGVRRRCHDGGVDERPEPEAGDDLELTPEEVVAADAAMLLDLGGAEELADLIADQSLGEIDRGSTPPGSDDASSAPPPD